MTPQLSIAVTRPNAPLAIVWIALVIKYPDKTTKEVNATDEYIRTQIDHHFGDDWTKYRVVTKDALPTDHTWREAWFDDGTTIAVSLARAKTILKTRISAAAAARIAETDAPLIEAMAAGDSKEQLRLVALRKAIHTASDDPRIEHALTLDELKAIDPLATIEAQRRESSERAEGAQ